MNSPGNRRIEAALRLQRDGRLDEAKRLYKEVLSSSPGDANALHLLGVLLGQRGDREAGLLLIEKSLIADPSNVTAHFNRGNMLASLGRAEAAIEAYRKALALAPRHAGAWTNMGAAFAGLGNHAQALECYRHALAERPGDSRLLFNIGNALRDLGRDAEALASFDAAIRADPKNASAWNGRGNTFARMRRYPEALADLEMSLTLRPRHPDTLYNRGNIRLSLGQFEMALSDYEAAIAAAGGEFPRAVKGAGNAYFELGRYEECFAAYDRAFAMDSSLPYLEGSRFHVKMHLCDWSNLSGELESLYSQIAEGKKVCEPFMLLPVDATPALQRRAAEIFASDRHPPAPAIWRGERYGHDKMRIGYVSGEFREQAVAHVTADLFECHDRNACEIFAFASGIDDKSPMRARLERAFDTFEDVSAMSGRALAERIRGREIDILVNLNGFFGVDRTEVFALRPAPVQVNYLGYPGTMGAPYMDYLIADRTVIPESDFHHYTEKIVHLPDCYQPADRQRTKSPRRFSRAEQGLPEEGFVFACFSTSHKILPAMFDVWMRILNRAQGSVLWLSGMKEAARRNLKREAEARGVSPERIVFANFLTDARDHLSRLSLADLFLDTLPHNAHTTATDALIAGVPVITAMGATFPSRVGASLLAASGLGGLVASSLEEYESLALSLLREKGALAAWKEKAARATTSRLFDTPRYARKIEAGYRRMIEIAQSGAPPRSFSVD